MQGKHCLLTLHFNCPKLELKTYRTVCDSQWIPNEFIRINAVTMNNESITTSTSFMPRLSAATGNPGGNYPDPRLAEASTLCPVPASNCSSWWSWLSSGLLRFRATVQEGGKEDQRGHCRWIAEAGHSHEPLSTGRCCLDSMHQRCTLSHLLLLVPISRGVGPSQCCCYQALPSRWHHQAWDGLKRTQ